MAKLRTIIVEDEVNAMDAILGIISRVGIDIIDVVGLASSAEEAEKLIKKELPQLVFLDIMLDGVDDAGFQLLAHFPSANFKVIFFTGHGQYAIKAFKFNALDFLTKPIDADEFRFAIEKAKKEIEMKAYHDELEGIISNDQKLRIPTRSGYVRQTLGEIIFFETGERGSTFFHLVGDKEMRWSSHSIGHYETALQDYSYQFYRCHAAFMVNRRHIVEYNKGEVGELIMSNGKKALVSKSKKKGFEEWLNLDILN